jgi:DNA-binding transcriptional LysR family regulator
MAEIETRLFRYFVLLADERHFSRAAWRLGITPPTLTHQIQKLERQLGLTLFDRKSRALGLTAAGARFLERARNVLMEITEAERAARHGARSEIGCVEIGFMPSVVCAGLMQKSLFEFRRANPGIELNVHRLVPMAQVTSIIRKDLDVGFTRGPHKYPAGLEGFAILRQPLILAFPTRHPLTRHKKIAPCMLKDEIFINTPPELDVGFGGHTEPVATMGRFSPNVKRRAEDLIEIITYVSMGYGIGVLPRSMSRMNIPNVVYRELVANPMPTSTIAFVYRRDDVSPAACLLIKFMRRYAIAC